MSFIDFYMPQPKSALIIIFIRLNLIIIAYKLYKFNLIYYLVNLYI